MMARWLRAETASAVGDSQTEDQMSKILDDFDLINKLSFASANQLVETYGISAQTANLIRRQPGYRSGAEMAVTKAKTGGWRLYERVSGQWMDASLEDMDSLPKAAAALGRKGGSVSSQAKSEAAKARNAKRKAEGKPEGGRPRKEK